MIDHSDLWFFNIVAEDKVPMCCLGVSSLEEMFNVITPGLTIEELSKLFWNYYELNLLSVWKNSKIFDLVPEQVLELMKPQPVSVRLGTPYFGFSCEGGVAWEESVNPDWSEFERCESYVPEGRTRLCFEISAGSESVALRRLNDIRKISANKFISSSVKMVELSDWNPTYWKTLKSGFGIVCAVSDPGINEFVGCSNRWFQNAR